MANLITDENGTIHYKGTVVKPRTRGGARPVKRPAAAICSQVDRLVANKIRNMGHMVLDLARRYDGGNHTLWGKAVQLQRELYTMAHNVQLSGVNPDQTFSAAAAKLAKFGRTCKAGLGILTSIQSQGLRC